MDPKMEMEVKMGLSTAEAIGKRVVFPGVRSFEELFSGSRVIKNLGSGYQSWEVCSWTLDEGGEAWLNSFCSVDHREVHLNLDVTPFEHVYDAIEANMLLSKDYTINFCISVRENGTALVYAKYDRILGDRWFAIIDASTIPGLAEAIAQEKADEEMVTFPEKGDEEIVVLDLFGTQRT